MSVWKFAPCHQCGATRGEICRPQCANFGEALSSLDLSPLQKFMGMRGEFWVEVEDGQGLFGGDFDFQGALDTLREYQERARVRIENNSQSIAIIQGVLLKPGQCAMYGMDYDFDWVPTAPTPEPEKSPQEKILDEFIRKREAKRVQPPEPAPWPGFDVPTSTERALDRAMRRLGFHEQDIHTRLMPYRREE